MEGDLTLDELSAGDAAKIEATICSRGYESYFYQKWLEHRSAATRVPRASGHSIYERFWRGTTGSW